MSETISSERTRNYLRQIKGAIFYRATAVGASFIAIPLMIHYLGEEQFGVWSTLLTVMSWIVLFDLGIGNGLRNMVAESLAKNDSREARRYISSGYILLGIISIIIWMLITFAAYFVTWQSIFNTQEVSEKTLRETIHVAAFFILLNFWVGIITALYGAVQKSSFVALGQLISNVMVLALVVVLTKYTSASLSLLALVYGLSLVTANIFLSWRFFKSHPDLLPQYKFNINHARPLLGVGLQFFIIQIAVLVIFTTDKMLITQLFGPLQVTQYEIIFKLFSCITFLHGLVAEPLWSAYTEAYQRRDIVWIKIMLTRQLQIFAGILVLTFILNLISEPLINIWIGPDVLIKKELVNWMSIFVLIATWNNIFAMIVNGVGKLKLQLDTAIVAMVVNIPVSIYLAKYTELGVSGIVAGTAFSLLFAGIVLPLQVRQLIRS